MFFAAAKIFWALFQPSNLMAALAAGGLIAFFKWRRIGMNLLIASGLLLVLFGLLPMGQLLISPLEDRFPRASFSDGRMAYGIIILGGTEQPDLSWARSEPSLGFDAARLARAAMVAHRFPGKPVIYTGGYKSDHDTTQADVASDFLLGVDIERARLRLENQSLDTMENAQYVKKLLGDEAQKPWLLVTSAFHMPRAVGTFRKAGITIIPNPVAYRSTGYDLSAWKLDVAGNLRISDLAVHEWTGLLAYYLSGRSDALFPSP